MTEHVLTNARIVLPGAVLRGSVVLRHGRIAAIDEGAVRIGEDVGGDDLLPGLVELHTDHIEAHYVPRPKVRWPMPAAVLAHDAQLAASGITTVLDALRVGMDEDTRVGAAEMRDLAAAIDALQEADALRAEHFVHLRCEVASPDVMDGWALFAGYPRLKLVSLMDHTPGQRQFVDLKAHKTYYQGKSGISDADYARFVEEQTARGDRHAGPNREAIAAACVDAGLPLASHDDATADHVAEGTELGVRIAEFPTTIEAAGAARAAGQAVLMGAPNMVRGGSHSGNIATADLAAAGLLDMLSSDYVPSSLLHAAYLAADAVPGLGLAGAVRTVSAAPAGAVGLDDRGAIEIDRRADLIRVRRVGGTPVVRAVWRGGRRVA